VLEKESAPNFYYHPISFISFSSVENPANANLLMKGKPIQMLFYSSLGMGLFPEMICSREREFPGIAEKIPGNSREFKIHYIGQSKVYIFPTKMVLFATFEHNQSNYGQIRSKILIFFQK